MARAAAPMLTPGAGGEYGGGGAAAAESDDGGGGGAFLKDEEEGERVAVVDDEDAVAERERPGAPPDAARLAWTMRAAVQRREMSVGGQDGRVSRD